MARFKDRIRKFNKHILNPLMGQLTRLRFGAFAMVHHRGRRSGRKYQTPITAFREDGGFLIALTYGPTVDWYRNLLSRQQGRLAWHQREYELQGISPVPANEALPRFPQPQQSALRLMGLEDFVFLDTAPKLGSRS